MTFPKRTFDKPIPICPLIALDRERCILCYRCTRFSEEVAEDGQLIAREPRRAVDDRDLRGRALPRAVLGQRHRALPGRRAHVHPVPLRGAAVGDPERADRLRPVPRRLQHPRDDARGQGQADPVAQPPRSGRGLALRQGPLRLPAPVRARPDRRPPAARAPAALRGRSPGRTRVDRAARAAASRRGTIVTALSGTETVEHAYGAGASSCARASARTRRAAGGDEPTRSTASGCRSRRSATRELVVVLGDEPVADRAPIVDLWIRPPAGTAPRSSRSGPPATSRPRPDARGGRSAGRRRAGRTAPRKRARDPDLVGRRRPRRRALAALARELGLAARTARRLPPARARRTRAASPTPGRAAATKPDRTRSRSGC